MKEKDISFIFTLDLKFIIKFFLETLSKFLFVLIVIVLKRSCNDVRHSCLTAENDYNRIILLSNVQAVSNGTATGAGLYLDTKTYKEI